MQTLGKGQGHLRAGLQGFQGSGKTWTAFLLAIGVRRHFNLDGPIVMFDTEGGSEYIAPLVKRETGVDLIGLRSRSLDDLLELGMEAETVGASVMVTDSMTHIWRDACESYKVQLNKMLVAKGKNPRNRLEFQDWDPIKRKFGLWTDLYLNAKLHMIICGRAGFTYDYEENDETGKKELLKTGLKMKTEGEFGFEPSLLIHMERTAKFEDGKLDASSYYHRASVLKDRFGLIDGHECDDPTFDFFAPHVMALTPGAYAPIDTAIKTDMGVRDDGDTEWQYERRQRTILCEEVQGELSRIYPGQTAKEKKAKLDLIDEAFKTRSWTKVETLGSNMLRDGLALIREKIGAIPPVAPAEPGEEVA
jgi:hypothetical protein